MHPVLYTVWDYSFEHEKHGIIKKKLLWTVMKQITDVHTRIRM
jgi:hypothetical protein